MMWNFKVIFIKRIVVHVFNSPKLKMKTYESKSKVVWLAKCTKITTENSYHVKRMDFTLNTCQTRSCTQSQKMWISWFKWWTIYCAKKLIWYIHHAHNGHLANLATIALQNITNVLKKIHLKQYKNIKFSLIHVIGGFFSKLVSYQWPLARSTKWWFRSWC